MSGWKHKHILDGSLLDSIRAEAALADKLLWGLVVDRGKRGQLGEELLQQSGRERVDRSHNWRLVGEHNVLRGAWIARVRQQAPVDVGPVANVGIVILGRGRLQHLLHQPLGFLGPFEEELHNSRQDLQLGLRWNISIGATPLGG